MWRLRGERGRVQDVSRLLLGSQVLPRNPVFYLHHVLLASESNPCAQLRRGTDSKRPPQVMLNGRTNNGCCIAERKAQILPAADGGFTEDVVMRLGPEPKQGLDRSGR